MNVLFRLHLYFEMRALPPTQSDLSLSYFQSNQLTYNNKKTFQMNPISKTCMDGNCSVFVLNLSPNSNSTFVLESPLILGYFQEVLLFRTRSRLFCLFQGSEQK